MTVFQSMKERPTDLYSNQTFFRQIKAIDLSPANQASTDICISTIQRRNPPKVQILDEAVCVRFTLCHKVSIYLFSPALDKYSGRLGSLDFVRQPLNEKQNPELKPALLCLKIYLISHSGIGYIQMDSLV